MSLANMMCAINYPLKGTKLLFLSAKIGRNQSFGVLWKGEIMVSNAQRNTWLFHRQKQRPSASGLYVEYLGPCLSQRMGVHNQTSLWMHMHRQWFGIPLLKASGGRVTSFDMIWCIPYIWYRCRCRGIQETIWELWIKCKNVHISFETRTSGWLPEIAWDENVI